MEARNVRMLETEKAIRPKPAPPLVLRMLRQVFACAVVSIGQSQTRTKEVPYLRLALNYFHTWDYG